MKETKNKKNKCTWLCSRDAQPNKFQAHGNETYGKDKMFKNALE